jgi:hypothetical protein
MASRVAKPACRWIGALFLALALAGYLDSPVIGQHGFIAADAGLSAVHAVVGVFLIVFSFAGESSCAFALYVGALALGVFAGYALYQLGSYDVVKLLDSLHATRSAAYFQLVLCVVMVVFGKLNTASKQLFRE